MGSKGPNTGSGEEEGAACRDGYWARANSCFLSLSLIVFPQMDFSQIEF